MRAVHFFGLAGLVACSSDGISDGISESNTTGTDPVGCESGDPTLDVGTGDDSYVALAANDPVTILHGPQGGWHVETAGFVARAGQEVSIVPTLFVPSLGLQIAGDQVLSFNALAEYDDRACAGQFWGIRAFVDDVHTPPDGMSYQQFICSLEGADLELSLTVSHIDPDIDRSVTSTVNVVAELDAADVPLCN